MRRIWNSPALCLHASNRCSAVLLPVGAGTLALGISQACRVALMGLILAGAVLVASTLLLTLRAVHLFRRNQANAR